MSTVPDLVLTFLLSADSSLHTLSQYPLSEPTGPTVEAPNHMLGTASLTSRTPCLAERALPNNLDRAEIGQSDLCPP